jgi:NTE family protein
MLRALLAAGVVPDLLVGCSVGALNAAFLACDPTLEQVDGLEAIWRSIERSNVFGGSRRTVAANVLRRSDHLYEADGLRALIRASMPITDLADTVVPVQVVTTDLGAGVPAWWTAGDPVEILSASACLPGVFPPVRIEGRLHVDGGVLCPVPTARALALGAADVWVLDASAHKAAPLPEHPTALEVLLASFAAARRALSEAGAAPGAGQTVHVLRAVLPPGLDARDFSQTPALIEAGAEAARSALAVVESEALAG